MIGNVKTGYWALEEFRKPKFLDANFSLKKFHIEKHSLKLGFVEVANAVMENTSYMCNVNGNLHKYTNKGTHDADSFRLSDLHRVFTELNNLYCVNPYATPLYSVEFGVNIKLSYDPQRILKAIRMYKGYTFTPIGKIGLEYKTKEYRIKIYDKGEQCDVPGFENVLRIEMATQSSYLKKRGFCIPLLGNLLNTDTWRVFEFLLLEAIDNIMIIEVVPFEGLTKKERGLFALFLGDDWQALDKVKRCRTKKKFIELVERLEISKPTNWQGLNRNVLHKKKKTFKEVAERTTASSLKDELKRMIKEECELLRDIDI